MVSKDQPGENSGSVFPQPDAICMNVMCSEKIDCALSIIYKNVTGESVSNKYKVTLELEYNLAIVVAMGR